ncbi:MAG TPA: ABC transporter substrate-binding protein, partial [Burkholderiales bacterium]|nr:ABC transporter substrate-binding protein [Burkholderiales bacterium]
MTCNRRTFAKMLWLCGAGLALNGSVVFAQGRQKVRIGLPTRVYWPAIPVHVAQDLKLYEKEGLDAEITIYNSGGAAMEAVAAGACDIISASPASVAAARVRGVKAMIVASGMQTPTGFYVLVKEGSAIRTLKDLEGKRLGITATGSTTDFLALWVMEKSGAKITRVAVGGGALVPNLLNGQLDAIVAFPPLGYSLLVSKE